MALPAYHAGGGRISTICSTILTQQRRVWDRQTDG